MKTEQETPPLSVSELNQWIRGVLEMGFPNAVWVCGEIQGYDRNRDKRHVFFELCEKDPESKDIRARIGLVIFANRRWKIEEILKNSASGFSLKDDIEVKFLCRVDFYPPHGAVRLVVEEIDPVYTLGRIAQAKQRLIAELRAKGILDQNKALPLPEVPLRIGLITSHDSAAYNDFLAELKVSGFGFTVRWRNTLMQGRRAAEDVCRALAIFQRKDDLDVIVITRGGGSLADLSCFDSEAIARAVAVSRYPVISGIGHEINLTVTDLAAHTFQKTPTATARFLIERVESFGDTLNEYGRRVGEGAYRILVRHRDHVHRSAMRLQGAIHQALKSHRHRLFRLEESLRRTPLLRLAAEARGLDDKRLRMNSLIDLRFKSEKERLKHYQRLVEVARPEKILKRGFSITRRKGGAIVRRAEDVLPWDEIETTVGHGLIFSRVEVIRKED